MLHRSNSHVPLQLCHGRSAMPRWRPEDGEGPQASTNVETWRCLQPERKKKRMKNEEVHVPSLFFGNVLFFDGRC